MTKNGWDQRQDAKTSRRKISINFLCVFATWRLGVIFLCLIVSGCGYRFNESPNSDSKQTLSIPYIPGDVEGQLNAALVEAISQTGHYEYRRNDGVLLLQVAIINDNSERIDFRYDREPSGKREKNLLATANRRSAVAEVTLIDTRSDEILLGPSTVSASADFEYESVDSIVDMVYFPPKGPPQTVLNFSLGQLDSIEGGHDDSASPLYRHLAQKIADGIVNRE